MPRGQGTACKGILTQAMGVQGSWGSGKQQRCWKWNSSLSGWASPHALPPSPDSLPASRETGALQGKPWAERGVREKGGSQQVSLDRRPYWMALGTGFWTVTSQQFKNPVPAVAKLWSGGRDGRRGLASLRRGLSAARAASSSCLVSPQRCARQCCSTTRLNTARRQEKFVQEGQSKRIGKQI